MANFVDDTHDIWKLVKIKLSGGGKQKNFEEKMKKYLMTHWAKLNKTQKILKRLVSTSYHKQYYADWELKADFITMSNGTVGPEIIATKNYQRVKISWKNFGSLNAPVNSFTTSLFRAVVRADIDKVKDSWKLDFHHTTPFDKLVKAFINVFGQPVISCDKLPFNYAEKFRRFHYKAIIERGNYELLTPEEHKIRHRNV